MAWYTNHTLRYRGRLVAVYARYGGPQDACVVKGKPLDFGRSVYLDSGRELSRDAQRLRKLFFRSKEVRREIDSMKALLAEREASGY